MSMPAWTPKPVRCGRCAAALSRDAMGTLEMGLCPQCNAHILVRVFPAILSGPRAISPDQTRAGEGEASCFFHPRKTAVVACSHCGRFLCQLCRVELHGEDWCPECLSSGIQKKKIVTLENSRILYDTVALALATIPALAIWPTLISAPAALFVAFRYWKTPLSVVRRTKLRFLAAILLSAAEIAAWILGILYLFYYFTGARGGRL